MTVSPGARQDDADETKEAMAMTAETASKSGRGIPWRIIGWGAAALLLLLPYVVGAPWTGSDYVFVSALFGLVGLGAELTLRIFRTVPARLAAAIALLAVFFLVWINASVGIIGDEGQRANALFLLPIAVAVLGSLVAMFRASGMAWAMAAAALAQASVPLLASAFAMAPAPMVWDIRAVLLTLFFTGAWLAAAALFRRSDKEDGSARAEGRPRV